MERWIEADMLRIVDWEKHFENNRTKELKRLSWVPLPNRHDGDGYTELLDHPNGASHFGCWCAIVQVASKCDVRGTLSRDGARAHDAVSLARMTRINVAVMREAIHRLVHEIKWLEVIGDGVDTSIPQEDAVTPQPAAALPEGNGREQNGTEVPPKSPKGEMTALEFFNRWNKFVSERPKLAACRKLTEERAKKIRSRLAQDGWLKAFREAVAGLPLAGDGWQPNLDWFVRNEQNVYRVLEGAFDWRSKDDPAAQKLQSERRKRAARESEASAAQQKLLDKQASPQLRNAIECILNQSHGSSDDKPESSLLFGLEGTSCVSGAAVPGRSGEITQKSTSEAS